MSNALTLARLAGIIKKMPEKTFRITALAPQVLDAAGKKVDIEKAMQHQGELNLAIQEVRSYVQEVHALTKRLQYAGGKNLENGGFFEEEDIEVGEEDGL